MRELRDGNYGAHPNFIRLNDVGTADGKRIACRIDNASAYLNAKAAMNDYNGINFQVNMAPMYNVFARECICHAGGQGVHLAGLAGGTPQGGAAVGALPGSV